MEQTRVHQQARDVHGGAVELVTPVLCSGDFRDDGCDPDDFAAVLVSGADRPITAGEGEGGWGTVAGGASGGYTAMPSWAPRTRAESRVRRGNPRLTRLWRGRSVATLRSNDGPKALGLFTAAALVAADGAADEPRDRIQRFREFYRATRATPATAIWPTPPAVGRRRLPRALRRGAPPPRGICRRGCHRAADRLTGRSCAPPPPRSGRDGQHRRRWRPATPVPGGSGR